MSLTSPLTVALVEDDPSGRRALSRLLQAYGVCAVAYESAEAFLAEARDARLDCILLDIQLPGMSGIELHNHLAGEGSSVPVVFLTAYDESTFRAMPGVSPDLIYLGKTSPARVIMATIHQATAARKAIS